MSHYPKHKSARVVCLYKNRCSEIEFGGTSDLATVVDSGRWMGWLATHLDNASNMYINTAQIDIQSLKLNAIKSHV